jgi:outer membrane immunogenic protein
MQRLLFGLAGVLLTTTAYAADMPLKAPPVVAAAAFSWTGFYLGGYFGWGFEHHTVTNVGSINSANFPAGYTSSADIDGALGGAQLGYDWQFSPNWLVGIGADIAWSGIKGDANNPGVVNPLVVSHVHHDYSWLSTVTGRFGYVANNWLLYAKGGAAWAESKSSSYTTNAAGVTTTTTEGSLTRTGWTAGGGLEWRFAKNWSALVEYDYVDFGIATASNAVTFGTTAPVLTGATLQRDNKAYMNVVKVGVNYRF